MEHHPGHGEWIRVLGAHGFVVEGLRELHAPADHDPGRAAVDFYDIADLAWARRWPAEDLWSARLGGDEPDPARHGRCQPPVVR